MRNFSFIFVFILIGIEVQCQTNPLYLPPTLTGTMFNLNIHDSTWQFWNGINTPTYGINGAILGPTIVVNQWDDVTMNVTNNLTGPSNSTTMHWHGMHVPQYADGGPMQVINQVSTWSPTFKIMNPAGTYWYHPHGQGKTDRHVSKGLDRKSTRLNSSH